MKNLKKKLKLFQVFKIILGGIFEKFSVDKKIKEFSELESDSNFWSDRKKATNIIKEKNRLLELKNSYSKVNREIINTKELMDLSLQENNNILIKECYEKIDDLLSLSKKNQVKCFLSGKDDDLNVFIEIHAGAGGTESQDWADMLKKMYVRWLDKKDCTYNLISEHSGEEAGIKSCTIKATGNYLYGLLKKESGIHRLVRISPFDSGARRHTSFASVWVYPVVDDEIDITILDKDLRIDTYRSSGAGGQHVNTTDSAVRITHLPTKIVVQCQNERSQHKNKETCMKILKSRLYEYESQKREKENEQEMSKKTDIGWGHQIRSYVLQPYRLVKDLRTNIQDSDPEKILNGNIDKFIEGNILI